MVWSLYRHTTAQTYMPTSGYKVEEVEEVYEQL